MHSLKTDGIVLNCFAVYGLHWMEGEPGELKGDHELFESKMENCEYGLQWLLLCSRHENLPT